MQTINYNESILKIITKLEQVHAIHAGNPDNNSHAYHYTPKDLCLISKEIIKFISQLYDSYDQRVPMFYRLPIHFDFKDISEGEELGLYITNLSSSNIKHEIGTVDGEACRLTLYDSFPYHEMIM